VTTPPPKCPTCRATGPTYVAPLDELALWDVVGQQESDRRSAFVLTRLFEQVPPVQRYDVPSCHPPCTTRVEISCRWISDGVKANVTHCLFENIRVWSLEYGDVGSSDCP
jgi:hypothetical protein